MAQQAEKLKQKLERIQREYIQRWKSEDNDIKQEWVHFAMYFVVHEEYNFADDKLFQLYPLVAASLEEGSLEAKMMYILMRTIAEPHSKFRIRWINWIDESVPDWDDEKLEYFRKVAVEYNEIKSGAKPEKKAKNNSMKEDKAKEEAAEKQRKYEAYQRQQEWKKKTHKMIERHQQQQRQKQTEPKHGDNDDEKKKEKEPEELSEDQLIDKLGDIIERAKKRYRALSQWQSEPYINFAMYVVVKQQHDFEADAMWKQYGVYDYSADKHPLQARMTYIWMCAMVEPGCDIARQFKKWNSSTLRLKNKDEYLEDIKSEYKKLEEAEKQQEKETRKQQHSKKKVEEQSAAKEKPKDVEQFQGKYPAYLCLGCRRGGHICERHVERLITRRPFMDDDDEDHHGYNMYVCQRCWAGHQQCFRHAAASSSKAKFTKYIARCGCHRCGEIAKEQRRCLQCDRFL